MAEEQAIVDAGHHDGGVEEIEGVPPQILATPGMPERQAVGRRQARVREMMHTLPPAAQAAIRDDLEGTHKYVSHSSADDAATARHRSDDDAPTASNPILLRALHVSEMEMAAPRTCMRLAEAVRPGVKDGLTFDVRSLGGRCQMDCGQRYDQ